MIARRGPEAPRGADGTTVCTALMQRLLAELRRRRAAAAASRDQPPLDLGVETVVSLVRCGCACRSWTRAVIPRLVLLLAEAFGASTRVAAARALRGLLRGQSSSELRRLVVGSDVLPPLLMMVQHADASLAAAGAELATELARPLAGASRDGDDRDDDWRADALQLLPALSTDVPDAAAAIGAWPVRVVEHRPSLNPRKNGHLSVLDIRADAFSSALDQQEHAAAGDRHGSVEVYRQLVLGIWEVCRLLGHQARVIPHCVCCRHVRGGRALTAASPC